MESRDEIESSTDNPQAGTLGAILYAGTGTRPPPESEWVALVGLAAGGDQSALHALYDRAHRLVFTLAVRITGCRETAEEVTLDVFHDVWRRAGAYDAGNGTVVGWIMNLARSRAIDRVRFEHRAKRHDPRLAQAIEDLDVADLADPGFILELKQQARAMRNALGVLTPEERNAIEAAFFSGLTHAEVASRLQTPLGTVKTRIRSGLQKLRRAIVAEGKAT